MRAVDLEAFIETAEPGDQAIYYVGHLGHDRIHSPLAPEIDRAARYASDHADMTRLLMLGDGHARGQVIGSGELRLSQTRAGPDAMAYLVTKRGRS